MNLGCLDLTMNHKRANTEIKNQYLLIKDAIN